MEILILTVLLYNSSRPTPGLVNPVKFSTGNFPVPVMSRRLFSSLTAFLLIPAMAITFCASAASAATTYRLSLYIKGSGSGTVTGYPGGFSTNSDISVTLPANYSGYLEVTPSEYSVFSGWSGSCSGSLKRCDLVMDANKTVNASFNLDPAYKVQIERIQGDVYFHTLQSAIISALSGETIKSRAVSFDENIVIGNGNNMSISGGHDASYTSKQGASILNGLLMIERGTLVASDLIIAGDKTPPTAPGNLDGTVVSSSQINLSWSPATDNTGVTGYRLERCQGASCSSFSQIATPAATSYTDASLTASTSYSYRVRAQDDAGNLSGYSNTYSGSTLPGADTTPPTAPANLGGTVVSSSQINLSWTPSTDNIGVTGYRLERCQGASCSSFSQIATPAATSYTDASLTASTGYSYRVRAVDDAGNPSGYSNTYSATTQNGGNSTTFPGGTLAQLRALSPTLTFGDLTIGGPLTIPSSETAVTLTVANMTVNGYISVTHPTCSPFPDSPDLTINAAGSVTINSPISLTGKSGEGETDTSTCNDCNGQDGGNLTINATNIYVNNYADTWGGSGSRYLAGSYELCDYYSCVTRDLWVGCNGGNGGKVTLNATGVMTINPQGADIDIEGGDGGVGSPASVGGNDGSPGIDGALDWNGPSISVAEIAGDYNMQISGAQLLDYDKFSLQGSVMKGEEFSHRGVQNNSICVYGSGATSCQSTIGFVDWIEDLYLLDVRYPPIGIPTGRISILLSLSGNNASADLDLYIFNRDTGAILGSSSGPTGNESISTSLSPGKYLVGVSYADDGLNLSTAYILKFKQ